MSDNLPVRDPHSRITELTSLLSECQQSHTQLEESETRYRLAARATEDVIWDWDLVTQQIWWNEGIQTLFGYSSDSFKADVNWWYERIHSEDRQRVISGIHAFINGGGQKWTDEYRFLRADGTYAEIIDRGYVVRDPENMPRRLVGAMMDITQRKQAETILREANQMKDEFLATVSHELRTPLNAILGWARMLSKGNLDGATSAHGVEVIERNAKSQMQLIEDLLDVSRIVSGKIRLDIRSIDLLAVIDAAMETVRPAAEAKSIQLQVLLDSQAGPVAGDPGRLQQIIWNLLSNAVKFTPKGGHVKTQLKRRKSSVEIKVTDTGKGISPAFLPHVFERFRQADGSPTRSYSGLGLGLAIVRHLVELHGGTVSAQSRGANQGAAFTVALPLLADFTDLERILDAPEASSPALPATLPSDGTAAPTLEGVRVLVVEDEPDTRQLLILILEGHRAVVSAVGSAAEGLEALKLFKPAVLISDIGMPGEDGYSLMSKVRALKPEEGGQIPAAALTAHASVQDRMHVLSAGYHIHVPKPVEPAELVAVVASLARRTPAAWG